MSQQQGKRNLLDGSQARAAQSAKDQRLSDMALLLSTRPGRRFVWGLMSDCGIFRTSFDNSGSVTAFNEGRREIGLRVLADVNDAAPDQYLVMLRESKEASNG